eukprot:TCONS_00005948-protein
MAAKMLICLMVLTTLCHNSLAIICNIAQTPAVFVDCANKRFGDFHDNVCMISIMEKTWSNVTSGCFPKRHPLSRCDTEVNVPGRPTEKICCCTADQCNDDVFITECRDGTAPAAFPPFTCHQSVQQTGAPSAGPAVSGPIPCNLSKEPMLDKCHYTKTEGNRSAIIRGCVPKNRADQCDKKMVKGNEKMISCCCNSTNCNDDAFVEKCLASAAAPPLTTAAGASGSQQTTAMPSANGTTTTPSANQTAPGGSSSASSNEINIAILSLAVIAYKLTA